MKKMFIVLILLFLIADLFCNEPVKKEKKLKHDWFKLAVSVTSFIAAYDNFTEVKNIKDKIDDYEELEYATSDDYSKQIKKLKKDKTRKQILAISFSALSAVSFVTTLEWVEVEVTPVSLSLNYRF